MPESNDGSLGLRHEAEQRGNEGTGYLRWIRPDSSFITFPRPQLSSDPNPRERSSSIIPKILVVRPCHQNHRLTELSLEDLEKKPGTKGGSWAELFSEAPRPQGGAFRARSGEQNASQ